MRRIAFSCLCLALSGCGYNTWWNTPFTTGSNPNRPVGESANMRRVLGEEVQVPALMPEPGDIWPGPLPPEPTLMDFDAQRQQPAPGELARPRPTPQTDQGPAQFIPPPPAARGSSTPPGSVRQGLTPLPATPQRPVDTTPPARSPAGQVTPTQQGPGVTTGGGTSYQTITTPGGGSAIVVPNGNGTSTIIHSDGRIETVPTPR